jgi:hypothetical protein
MRGDVFVRLYGGALHDLDHLRILGGENRAALRAPGAARWELIQFVGAELVGPRTYRLSGVLRGQAGTEASARIATPPGAAFVLLDDAPVRVELEPAGQGLPRRYRIGPAHLRVEDAAFVEITAIGVGVGAEPLSPAHLRVRRTDQGGWRARWFRRSRFDADGWASPDAPLRQMRESYSVRVTAGGTLKRAAMTGASEFHYSTADASADGVTTPFEIAVAQLSDGGAPGPYVKAIIHE